MKTRIEKDRYYTVQEIANKLLPFGERNLRRLIMDGQLPAQNVGAGRIRCRWEVLGNDIIAFKEKMATAGRKKIARR